MLLVQYEDPVAQALAMSLMPLDELEAQASEAMDVSTSMGEQPPLAREDALAQGLLDWFKGQFFTWVGIGWHTVPIRVAT